MKTKHELPEGYKEICAINLQTDKRLALMLNAAALVVMLVMTVPMHFYVSVGTLFDMEDGIGKYILRFSALIVATIAYIVLHELVHGATMKLLGTKKVKYGFTGVYAYAGSDDYYDKAGYITIALAPIVVWGIVLAVINALVPQEWFWVVYFVQMMNVSGAVGDLYVTFKFSRMPKDILVHDNGVGMAVYSQCC